MNINSPNIKAKWYNNRNNSLLLLVLVNLHEDDTNKGEFDKEMQIKFKIIQQIHHNWIMQRMFLNIFVIEYSTIIVYYGKMS